MKDLKVTGRNHQSENTVIRLNDRVAIGGNEVLVIAGPCAVESREQMHAVMKTLQEAGIPALRGGAFKPRTSPYSFQGHGIEGLRIMDEIRKETGIAIVTEVMSVEQMELAEPYLDCFQVGSRNMQNFELLKELGKQEKPVLLKRGLCATIEEFLYSAEYIAAGGNHNIILCERGIRSYDPMTRNVLDIVSVPLLKELTHLPVIVDPSHATGKRSLILPASKAAVAIGADGLIVEAHPVPEKSVSDAAQALGLEELKTLVREVEPVAKAIGRQLSLTSRVFA